MRKHAVKVRQLMRSAGERLEDRCEQLEEVEAADAGGGDCGGCEEGVGAREQRVGRLEAGVRRRALSKLRNLALESVLESRLGRGEETEAAWR